MKLGVLDELAAELFALTIFLCDGLLHLKSPALISSNFTTAACAFFAIAKRLPMELQMLLCRCAVGSMKQNILYQDSEPAFHSLARHLLSSSHLSPMSDTTPKHQQGFLKAPRSKSRNKKRGDGEVLCLVDE